MKVGLAEFMSGTVGLDEIVHTDPTDKRLHIVPLRATVSGAADLLFTWDVRALIDTLRKRYDCVVLDAPPSLAINDIQPFATLSDATLFVVRWGSTSYSAAASGVTALSRIGLQISGAALTQVDLKRHALYGYEHFGEYHKHYLEYFQQPESKA